MFVFNVTWIFWLICKFCELIIVHRDFWTRSDHCIWRQMTFRQGEEITNHLSVCGMSRHYYSITLSRDGNLDRHVMVRGRMKVHVVGGWCERDVWSGRRMGGCKKGGEKKKQRSGHMWSLKLMFLLKSSQTDVWMDEYKWCKTDGQRVE